MRRTVDPGEFTRIAQGKDELERVPTVSLGSVVSSTASSITYTNGILSVSHPVVRTVTYTDVRVRYTFRTLVAWLFLPRTASIDRTVSLRQFP